MLSIYAASLATALALAPSFASAANHFAGIAAGNSIGGTSTYTCRTQDQWNTLANDLKNTGFPLLRIEGFDCGALDMASQAAASAGIKLAAGIYVDGTISNGMTGINNDVQSFINAYNKYGADLYATLTVGNEVGDSADAIMQKVYDVRGYLQSVGVTTKVATAHTWVFIRDNPQMCGADFVYANAHGFFDPPTTSGSVGGFITDTVVPALNGACPGADITISESGWPSAGQVSGNAGVGSTGDETTALKNLNCAAANGIKIFAFEYDDQAWKGPDYENSFGIFGKVDLNGDILTTC